MSQKYPLQPKKNYCTVEKNIYYLFNNNTYQVWKKKNSERIIIKNIKNINEARIIRSFINKYFSD